MDDGRATRNKRLTLFALILIPSVGLAQQSCTTGIRIEGLITDPTGSSIAGATVEVPSGVRTTTDRTGHFILPCVTPTSGSLTVSAEGFAPGSATVQRTQNGTAHINLQLKVAEVQTEVSVGGDDATGMDSNRGAGTTILTARDLQQLADDPDDFQRQLQALAGSSGGPPGSAILAIDGFQFSGVLPPKASIASIRINPDLFSAEYTTPPLQGGRIEITTKPGSDKLHGALFFIDSDGSFNATDPFSTIATPAGKRRYGFEIGGPILRNKSDFFAALEKRDIDEFNVVNAVTLDANDTQVPLHQTVNAPQRLWIASARGDWQATPTDVATFSFSANTNSLGNQGVGGLILAEAGYSSVISRYDLRATNTQTLNANLLNATRIGYTWKRTQQTPLSAIALSSSRRLLHRGRSYQPKPEQSRTRLGDR